MRVDLVNTEYTQTNTNTTSYIVQNLGNTEIGIIVSADKPVADDLPELILTGRNAISNNDIEGIIWAKSLSHNVGSVVGVVEG